MHARSLFSLREVLQPGDDKLPPPSPAADTGSGVAPGFTVSGPGGEEDHHQGEASTTEVGMDPGSRPSAGGDKYGARANDHPHLAYIYRGRGGTTTDESGGYPSSAGGGDGKAGGDDKPQDQVKEEVVMIAMIIFIIVASRAGLDLDGRSRSRLLSLAPRRAAPKPAPPGRERDRGATAAAIRAGGRAQFSLLLLVLRRVAAADAIARRLPWPLLPQPPLLLVLCVGRFVVSYAFVDVRRGGEPEQELSAPYHCYCRLCSCRCRHRLDA